MKKLFESVYQITHTIDTFTVNSYVVESGGALILIDTGFAGGTQLVLDSLNSIGRDITEVEAILLTHYHNDHTGNLIELQELSGARTYMGPEDAELLRAGLAWQDQFDITPGEVNHAIANTLLGVIPREQPAFEIDIHLHDRMDLGHGIMAVKCPGHTEGHFSFMKTLPNGKTIHFAGDAMATAFFNAASLVPVNFNLQLALESLEMFLDPNCAGVMIGHGEAILEDIPAAIHALRAEIDSVAV